MRGLLIVCSVWLWASCSQAPECAYQGSDTVSANAGCLVVQDGKLLIIEGRDGLFQLPGGGSDKSEPAYCTAERETWEETGIEVTANRLVTTFENGFRLHACTAVDRQALGSVDRPWRLEVKAVHWLLDAEFDGKSWRFPDQVEFMRAYLAQQTKTNNVDNALSQ